MKIRIFVPMVLALALLLGLAPERHAADKVKAIASFSILGDMVRNVGGDRVEVTTLVGPDGDAHVYEPTPADAKTLAAANILFVNGLGFEGWMDRLREIVRLQGQTVVASTRRASRGRWSRTRRRSPIRMPGRASPTASSMSPTSATG